MRNQVKRPRWSAGVVGGILLVLASTGPIQANDCVDLPEGVVGWLWVPNTPNRIRDT